MVANPIRKVQSRFVSACYRRASRSDAARELEQQRRGNEDARVAPVASACRLVREVTGRSRGPPIKDARDERRISFVQLNTQEARKERTSVRGEQDRGKKRSVVVTSEQPFLQTLYIYISPSILLLTATRDQAGHLKRTNKRTNERTEIKVNQ